MYYSGPDATIWKVPAAGGEAVRVLRTSQRAYWTASAAGIYVLDPDAKGVPTIEFFPFASKGSKVVRLPGEPGSYVDAVGGPQVSPDGRWILYMHQDGSEQKIMLVENFR